MTVHSPLNMGLSDAALPTVLITGASKGVGAACAHVFSMAYAQGVNLVLVARGIDGLEQLRIELLQ